MNLVKVCTNCGEDWTGKVCTHCGCADYDYAYADDIADRRTETRTMETTKVDGLGLVVTDTIKMLEVVHAVNAEGHQQQWPRLTIAMAQRADGRGWEIITEAGGDWCGVSPDDNSTAEAIGQMDARNTTTAARLRVGAEVLLSVAGDERLDVDGELVLFLRECAEDAAQSAQKPYQD